jgi:hypothetical protein
VRVTANLGSEHDEGLQHALLEVLRDMGADFEPADWRVGGSQEIITRCAMLGGERLEIEAETYVGLTLTGSRETVETVAARVRERPRL